MAGGSTFYSPPGKVNEVEHTFVADARHLLMKRMQTDEGRLAFLDEVRVLALTDPIPNDVCCVRRGFPKATWERFERTRSDASSPRRTACAPTSTWSPESPPRRATTTTFDGFRTALRRAGVSAVQLLEAEEERLRPEAARGRSDRASRPSPSEGLAKV